MKHTLLKLSFLPYIGLMALLTPASAQTAEEQVSLKWRATESYNGKDNLNLELVLKNKGAEALHLGSYDLWFNAMFPLKKAGNEKFKLSDERGNLFKIAFSDGLTLAANDSIVMPYASQYPIMNKSVAPNGFYLQDKHDPSKYFGLDLELSSIAFSKEAAREFWGSLYDKNQARQVSKESKLILPTPHSMEVGSGVLQLKGQVSYQIDQAFAAEETNIEEFAAAFKAIRFTESSNKPTIQIRKAEGFDSEGYGLEITKDGILIEASEGAGAYYALQSIRSLLTQSDFQAKEVSLPHLKVTDKPRYGYRGFMLDIARNFKEKAVILKYIDVISRFKVNTLHLHFIDDEGWRIEIAALPELTEIGAKRSPTFADGKSIQPAYGSGATNTAAQFLTREDFIEILRYAKQKHVTVVPEIETPGHARAAIKAMEARYNRFAKEGNMAEAERYLLHDMEDASVYSSVQYFNDNVINVALPSTYRFIGVVLDEFKEMYAAAGLTLEKVSLGGDEVPNGTWEGSPKVQALMAEKNFKSVYEVWPYYIEQVSALCASKGLQMAGWEEMGMKNYGKGMQVDPQLLPAKLQLDVWNNVVGGGQEDLAYRLANAGYETVYFSSNNTYFDMAWSANFEEPGFNWASYSDLYQAYTLLPEHFFSTIHHSIKGSKFEQGHFDDRVRLTEKGRANLAGLKGGLWAETLLTEQDLDYRAFPRFYTLAERAWSPRKAYESDTEFDIDAFNQDYSLLINKIGKTELNKLDGLIAYRLPAVGVKEIDGKLHANTEYPGFAIYYTLDGTTPSLKSEKYTAPVQLKNGQQATFVTIDSQGRMGTLSRVSK